MESRMKGNNSLHEQLNRYSETAPGGSKSDNGLDRWRSWPAYAAAAGSGLALATAAGADIIYSGPNRNVTAAVTGVSTNTNHAAFTDEGVSFFLKARHTGGHFAAKSVRFTGTAVRVLSHGGYAEKLASGVVISSGAGNFGTAPKIQHFTAHFGSKGNFAPPATGFVGVSFNTVHKKGHKKFGWIRLQVSDNGLGDGRPHEVTAVDWAYEDAPGRPIQAGDTGENEDNDPSIEDVATQESSTGALGLLAAGSLGILTWRKRRQAAAAAAIKT
jgi:hypothetical protein